MLKIKRNVALLVWMLLTLLIGVLSGCSKEEQEQIAYKHESMNVSWSYSYSGTEELAQTADLIAEISVTGRQDPAEEMSFPMTYYDAEVTRAIYGCERGQIIRIPMTGGIVGDTIYQISDDPLMEIGDTYLIFARGSGETYTILTGSQGRYLVEDEKITSLYGLLLQQQYEKEVEVKAGTGEEILTFEPQVTEFKDYPVDMDETVFYEKLNTVLENREKTE